MMLERSISINLLHFHNNWKPYSDLQISDTVEMRTYFVTIESHNFVTVRLDSDSSVRGYERV